jgi:CRISPR-associated protein Csd1
MILHELKALALREGLVDDPAFESKPVPWTIVLDEDGSYLSLRNNYQEVPLPEGKKGKPKRQASMFAIPRRLGRTSKAVSDFLIDKSEYVLGIEPDGKRSAEDLDNRRTMFADLLGEAADCSGSVMGKTVASFLGNAAERERCAAELIEQGYAGNDLFTFRVDGDFLHEDEALRRWWAERAKGSETQASPSTSMIRSRSQAASPLASRWSPSTARLSRSMAWSATTTPLSVASA